MIDLVMILLAIFSTVFTVYKYDKDKKIIKELLHINFLEYCQRYLDF